MGLIGIDGRVRYPDQIAEDVAIRADEDPHAGPVVQLDALAEVIEKAEGEAFRHVRQGAQHLVRVRRLGGKSGQDAGDGLAPLDEGLQPRDLDGGHLLLFAVPVQDGIGEAATIGQQLGKYLTGNLMGR